VGKVIKVSDDFYDRIAELAKIEGQHIGEAVEKAATPAVEKYKRFDELRKECAAEMGINVAADPTWEMRMLAIIPAGMSPELDEIRKTYACALKKQLRAQEEVTTGEVTDNQVTDE
jgi:DNA mismatch repair ATPase MutS